MEGVPCGPLIKEQRETHGALIHARQPSYLPSKILARRPAYPPADTPARRVNLPWIAEAEDEQSLGGIKIGGERRASVAHTVPDEALTRRPLSAKSLPG